MPVQNVDPNATPTVAPLSARASYSRQLGDPSAALHRPLLPRPAQRGFSRTVKSQARGKRPSETTAWEREWLNSAEALLANGKPINVFATFTWSALLLDDRRDGHYLGLPEAERSNDISREFRRILRKHGQPFYALRAPEYDATRGSHLHLALHVPHDLGEEMIALIERVTGAPRDPAIGYRHRHHPDIAKPLPTAGRNVQGVAASARPEHGRGWMVQWNLREEDGGRDTLIGYMRKHKPTGKVDGQYRRSNALTSLTRQYLRTAAQAM